MIEICGTKFMALCALVVTFEDVATKETRKVNVAANTILPEPIRGKKINEQMIKIERVVGEEAKPTQKKKS